LIYADILVKHNYLSVDGTVVESTEEETIQEVVGSIATIEAKEIEGYFPDFASQNIEVLESGNVVVFNYIPLGEVEYTVYYVDAEGTKHYLHEEAPISVQYFNIPEDVENNEENSTYLATLHDYVIEHDKEKQRRKFFARKMNEAEGFIPISYYGKAQG
jgi:hypothetical protein